jgi:hypothetical protein
MMTKGTFIFASGFTSVSKLLSILKEQSVQIAWD